MFARNRKITAAALAAVAVAAGSVYADPTVDGLLGTDYGSPIITQVNPTFFGDSTLGQQGYASGSELNAAYAKIAGGNLYLMLTGNLESNYNHLELFIDSIAGGQHTIATNNVDVDFNAVNRMGGPFVYNDENGNPVVQPGLTFDAGFAADFYIGIAGGDQGGQYGAFANYATLPTAGNGTGVFLGGGANQRVISESGTGITVAIDNSNTLGVTSTDAANPTSATSGIEYKIPLSAIGNPTGPIKITAFVNGSGHDYVSNQILGSLPSGYGNMGEPRNLDLSAHDGNQFFTIANIIPGDMNGDGSVDFGDLQMFRFAVLNPDNEPAAFNAQFPTGNYAAGDMNGDGSVDFSDLQPFRTMVLNPSAPAGIEGALAAVPEPACLGLLGLGAVALGARRRR